MAYSLSRVRRGAGGRLLERSLQSVSVTESGAHIYQGVKRILSGNGRSLSECLSISCNTVVYFTGLPGMSGLTRRTDCRDAGGCHIKLAALASDV